MLPLPETYERLTPRVRDLAGVLHRDPEVSQVAATVRFGGVDHELRLTRYASDVSLVVRAGRAKLYKGRLSAFYGAKERAR